MSMLGTLSASTSVPDVVQPHHGGAGGQAMGVVKWFGTLLKGGCSGVKMRVGDKRTWERGSSRVRDKIASVEASLAMLDHNALLIQEDTGVLVFDWDNCDAIEHESLRNLFRNTLLDDISDERSSVDSLSWKGVKARVRRSLRLNTTDKSSRRIKNWLDEVPAPPQSRTSFAHTYSSSERSGHSTVDMADTATHRPGQGVRRVGLLLWPPEIIARDVPSCYEEGIQRRTLADSSAHGRHAQNLLARQLQANADPPRHGDTSPSARGSPKAPADSPLHTRGISVVQLLLRPHKALKGILHHPNASPPVSGNNDASLFPLTGTTIAPPSPLANREAV